MSEELNETPKLMRSARKVGQHKLITRETARLLEDNGYRIFNSSYGMKNIFFLAKEAPELLQRVVDAMLTATDTRSLWNAVIGNEMGHRFDSSISRDHRLVYEKWLVLTSVAVDAFDRDRHGQSVYDAVRITEAEVRDKYYASGAKAITDFRLLAAQLIVTRFVKVTRRAMTDERRNENIAFIAGNLEAVAPLLSELMDRKMMDVGIMKSLLEVDTRALREGAL